MIRTSNDRTYLRIGDKSKEMLGENLRNLEYAKGSRHFEEEIHPYATIDDLDESLINMYKERIGARGMDSYQVLKARGFILDKDGVECLTNAAVLLFAENIMKFNMNCRIRFIRVDGRDMQVGDKYNVVKDKSIDEPILRLVNAAKAFIADQLRSFTRQEHGSGRFVDNPEYPEFPWVEGIINAVAHRDYAASGQFILVSMYDDRLEIESPGRFPGIVTADNITDTRFSRNKIISRVMTEFEWVRELNEGVRKIYSDMAEAGLPAPEFVETPSTVKLILRNNIDERLAYRNKALNEAVSEALNEAERQIVSIIMEAPDASQIEIAELTGFSRSKVQRIMKELTEKRIIYREGARKNGVWRVIVE